MSSSESSESSDLFDSLLLTSLLNRDDQRWLRNNGKAMDGRRWEYRVIEMLPKKVISGFLSYFSNPVSKFPLTYRNGLIIDMD